MSIKFVFYLFILIQICFSLHGIAGEDVFKGWDKLNTAARQFVSDKSNEGLSAEVIVKTKRSVNRSIKKSFKKVNFKYRSVINNIVTGSISYNNLPALAKLNFVENIELAVPLGPKKQ